MTRLFLVALLLCACLVAWGQNLVTFTLETPSETGYSYAVMPAGTSVPTWIDTKSTKTEIAAPSDVNGAYLWVRNTARNTLAKKSIIELVKTKSWKPDAKEFNRRAEVMVHLQPESGIVDAGMLRVQGKGVDIDIFVTASEKNKITLYDTPVSTNLNISFEFESNGAKETVKAGVAEDSDAKEPVVLAIPAKFESETAEPTPGASGETPAKEGAPEDKPAPAPKNPLASFFQMLVGLAIVGGLGYLGYWYYKNNTKVVETVLNQAGVNTSSNPDPTGAMPVQEPVKRDLQKIQLPDGDAGITTPVVGAAAGSLSSALVRNPRLVTASGDVVMLNPGVKTVGREGADLTLAGESSVSRQHASLTRDGDTITLTDLGSTNGTYLNGTKITTPSVLKPGDTIQFGAVAYRYEE